MAMTSAAHGHLARPDIARGPQVLLAVVVAIVVAGLALAVATLPGALVLPVVSVLLILLAGMVTAVAWGRPMRADEAPKAARWLEAKSAFFCAC